MSWWIGLVVLLLLGIAFLYKHTEKGVPRPVGGVEGALIALLRQGYDGGQLTLRVPGKEDRFFFFLKYIRGPGDYGVELLLSSEGMSSEFFAAAANFLRWRTPICKEVEGEGGDGHPSPALKVDFGKDTAEAARVVIELLHKVFDLTREDSIRVRLDNAAVTSTIVDGSEDAHSR
jgi:hypothetical protein